MKTPGFFAAVAPLRLQDPLAAFLGAAADGIVEYGYIDAVKLAGHSCPTVAAAYGMTRAALAALYGDELPQRGGMAVAFRERADSGVTGVIANVVSMLTGAAGEGGFKGLAGRFARRGLLSFGADVPLEARFTRMDTGAAVDVGTRLNDVPASPDLPALMQRAIAGDATPAEAARFGELWQARVRAILLEHADDPAVFIVRSAGDAS
jgi:formylmethanofuran dehydrogenase subunit E